MKVGDVVKATIVNIKDFGAFADFDGGSGLIYFTQIVPRVEHGAIEDVLSIGDTVDCAISEIKPDGKISLTMVSCMDVIEITEKEIDGVMREVCASPNDVPGYDKDQYIDPAILANVKGGSYAYCDEDGNYYRAGFGLKYN